MKMKKGEYYVGDLCYVLSDEQWDELCDKMAVHDMGYFELSDKTKVCIYHTAYGDGEYESNVGTLHPVDSGTIGCVLASKIVKEVKKSQIKDFGAIIKFDTDFECSVTAKGVLTFGPVKISTGFEPIH
jgi:hypothetical protein